MTPLLAAAHDIGDWLDTQAWQWCLIGGLAVQRWGEPRLTQDVDITVLTGFGNEEAVVDALIARFEPRFEDTRTFALRSRVVLLRASNGVGIDVSLGAIDFERQVIERATLYTFAPGCVAKTCSAEDLIVYKSVAGRPRDVADVGGIVARQFPHLDAAYVRRWLTLLGELKEDPDIARPFELAWQGASTRRPR